MKFDEKKRKRLAERLEPISITYESSEWLSVAQTAKKEGITVQAVLNRINTGKCEARAVCETLIVVRQYKDDVKKKEEEKDNVSQ